MANTVANNNNNGNAGNNGSSATTVVSTQLPGIDNSLVIPSRPHIVKENSSKAETKEIKLDDA